MKGKNQILKDTNSIYLQQKLLSLGNVVPLDLNINFGETKQTISAYKEHFKPYNPRKKEYKRYGLSLTSQDGSLSGIPNLDSLYEYNKLHGTNFNEPDFRKWTSVFNDCSSLKEAMKPFHNCMGRSHILRLDKGGFSPPHRDLCGISFRLLISLSGIHSHIFILDEKRIFLEDGQLYFINTLLSHSLFSFKDGSLFVIFNIDLTEEAVKAVYNNLSSY